MKHKPKKKKNRCNASHDNIDFLNVFFLIKRITNEPGIDSLIILNSLRGVCMKNQSVNKHIQRKYISNM